MIHYISNIIGSKKTLEELNASQLNTLFRLNNIREWFIRNVRQISFAFHNPFYHVHANNRILVGENINLNKLKH